MGKYIAYVIDNEYLKPSCPYKGCIRVVSPSLFGWKSPIPPISGLPFVALKPLMRESDWIRPHWNHPEDFYVPGLGEGVYVEVLEGKGLDWCIWTGFFPGQDFINSVTGVPTAGINKNVGFKTDRVIGTRSGHNIKFTDTPAGGITIEVLGKSMLNPAGNSGSKMELTPTSAITTGMTETVIKDVLGNKVSIDAGGITVQDATGISKITITPTGIIIESPLGITLKTADSAPWKPNCLPGCLFAGAPHSTVVLLKGA